MLNLGAFQVCRFTHTSLLLFLLQFLLCVTINYPKIKTFCSNLLPSSLRGNGPKERSHLARTAETASAETRPLSGVKKKTPPFTLTKPQGQQKGSQRPGQRPEPMPLCLRIREHPGQPTLPKAPARWRKPCSQSAGGKQTGSRTDTTALHDDTQVCRHAGDRAPASRRTPPDLRE